MFSAQKLKIKGLGIGQKVAIVLLLVSLIAVSITAAIFYLRSQSTLTKITNEHLLSVSTQQYYQVLQSIERIRDQLALITSRTQLRLSMNHFLTDKQQDKVEQPEHRQRMLKILSDAKQSVPNIIDLAVLDLNGELVVSTTASDFSKLMLSAEQTNPIANTTTVDIVQGVDNRKNINLTQRLYLNGEAIGFLILKSDLSSFTDVLLNHKGLGETEEAFLVYKDGNDKIAPLTPLKFVPAEMKPINIDPFRNALDQTKKIMTYIDYRGNEVFAVTRVFPHMGWGLIFKIDKNDVMKEIIAQRNFILVAFLICAVLVLVVAVLLSRSLTRPIIDMVEVATVIAQGGLSKRIKHLSQDELGLLAIAINKMADKLIDANVFLEKSIEDKTTELIHSNKRLVKLSEELKKRSLEDGLTQIANRRAFDEGIDSEWKRCRRSGNSLSLILVDIDFFKPYNDSLGHQAGDRCLYEVAQLIRQFANREGDIAARFGGEEFALILPNTSREDCHLIARRVQSAILAEKMPHPDSVVNKYLTVSVGAGSIIPSDKSNIKLFIQSVDVALYRAKRNGRNRVEVAMLG